MANKNNTQPQLPLYYNNTEVEITIDGVKKISEFIPILESESVTGLTFDVLLDGVNRQLPITSIYNDINKIHYIEKTYDEMIAMQTNNQFVINQNYLITDYRTTYIQPTTNIQMGGVGQENENEIEQIIVTALSTNQLQNDSRSLKYPQDIIYYNLNDNSEGFTKGKIYRRIDTLYKNDIGTDFRHIKYRRWKLNVTNQWVSGGNYPVGSIVVDKNIIYINPIEDLNSGGLTNKWISYGFENGTYSGFADWANLIFDSTNQPSLIPVNPNDYLDSYLFEQYNSNINNCVLKSTTLMNVKIFGQFHDDIFIDDYVLNNINIGERTFHIKIGQAVNDISIGETSRNIFIGNESAYVSLGRYSFFIHLKNCGVTSIGTSSNINVDDNVSFISICEHCDTVKIGYGSINIIIDSNSNYLKIGENVNYLKFDNYNVGKIQLIEVNPNFHFPGDPWIDYPGIPDYLSWFDTLKTVNKVSYYPPSIFYVTYTNSFGDEINVKTQL